MKNKRRGNGEWRQMRLRCICLWPPHFDDKSTMARLITHGVLVGLALGSQIGVRDRSKCPESATKFVLRLTLSLTQC